jgi:hypothetical protein
MGVDSNNYVLEAERCDTASFVAILERHGATDGGSPLSFVLSSDGHWIDAQVFPGSADRVSKIELRVALTNPFEAIDIVLALLTDLLGACGGVVLDKASGQAHRALECAHRSEVVDTWKHRQSEFVEQFGRHRWPISGAEVFPRMRALGLR